jgi:hypothetical protein
MYLYQKVFDYKLQKEYNSITVVDIAQCRKQYKTETEWTGLSYLLWLDRMHAKNNKS